MPTSQRALHREQMRSAILDVATEQLAERGGGGISMKAIANDLSLTPPALFRYFPNRDDLITALVVRAYEQLAIALEQAAASASLERAVRQQCAALRQWALDNPHAYLLIYGTPVPGYHAPTEITQPAAARVLRAGLAPFAMVDRSGASEERPIDDDLSRWAADVGIDHLPPIAIRQTFASWTRLHGILSLELAGHFGPGMPDPARLFDAEVDDLVEMIRPLIDRKGDVPGETRSDVTP